MRLTRRSDDGAPLADDAWQPDPSAKWQFYVDVVGGCNLRCPSCPVGNSDAKNPNGHMRPEFLDRIVGKAVAECPRVEFGLFNWTEPFMHPDLAAMVRVVKSHGVACGLSSNFNIMRNIDALMEANPDYLKVSVSGFHQDHYGVTHKLGEVDAVKRNMIAVAEAKQRAGATTRLTVPFHRYLGNHEDEAEMKEFSESLGFDFDPAWAYLMPMEKALAFAQPDAIDVKLTVQDEELIERLALPLGEAIEACKEANERRCKLRDRQMALNHEGKMMLCCATYDQQKYVLASYLELPLAELQELKFRHEQCTSCMQNGLHTLYTYGTDRLDELALANVARHHPDAVLGAMGHVHVHGVRAWPRKLRRKYRQLTGSDGAWL